MMRKQRLRRAYKVLKRISFYLLLVFLTSLILGLISGITWMYEMALVSVAASFGTISASDLLWDHIKGPKKIRNHEKGS